MIKHVQVWSHRDKEYMVPVFEGSKAKPQELVYPRVTIAAVFNGSKTLIGVSQQHPEDKDNKEYGQEVAVENALIRPITVINFSRPISDDTFDRIACGLYKLVSERLKPIAKYTRTMEDIEKMIDLYQEDWDETCVEYPYDDCVCGEKECNCNCKCCDNTSCTDDQDFVYVY